ncbi:hypothetical protein [uncultured Leifsonia sp.]|uniref:hypothetical protein n=1 Tax=uncultured Leifsonia sp. TaxID=340359 RepID=UPI0025EB5FE7|nr:hypothetical protein [uncultured Leifsonia sp.]
MGPGLHTLNDKTVVITGASGGIGIFDDRSKRRSPQRWASEHHWALVTAGTAAAATVAAAIGRRAVKGVR